MLELPQAGLLKRHFVRLALGSMTTGKVAFVLKDHRTGIELVCSVMLQLVQCSTQLAQEQEGGWSRSQLSFLCRRTLELTEHP